MTKADDPTHHKEQQVNNETFMLANRKKFPRKGIASAQSTGKMIRMNVYCDLSELAVVTRAKVMFVYEAYITLRSIPFDQSQFLGS